MSTTISQEAPKLFPLQERGSLVELLGIVCHALPDILSRSCRGGADGYRAIISRVSQVASIRMTRGIHRFYCGSNGPQKNH